MKHLSIVFALLAIVFLIMEVPAAQATVETGWPVSKPNTPRNTDDLFIDFEKGIEGIQIESTIPSLKFTTTSGLNWKYGDIRTGNYNVNPYGSKRYETRGNFFAWLGETGDTGRIDFPGGDATYCSVLVSTYSGVVLDAYDSEHVLIATSGKCNSNLDTGTLTRLTVDAPSGQYIAYVLIHDTGNYWLMDDLCTDAKGVIPVPGRTIGDHGDKFDIVFVPDNDYGSSADIDTWLPDFLNNINDQIDQRLGGAAPVSGNLDKFNFYYTRMQGTASSKALPADLTQMSPFADAYVIFHTNVFTDSTRRGTPSYYSAEGPVNLPGDNGRSFIHESGHGIFQVADEYDCSITPPPHTHYFQPDPMPNIWANESLARADATNEGWNPEDVQKFTDLQGGWWKLGKTKYIMEDGYWFANGWGKPAERRIQWFLSQYQDGSRTATASSQSEKSICLNLEVSDDVFSLLDESFVTDSAPDYLPGKYDFTAKVYSTSGTLLGEYGFNDPRRILAESGHEGPTWLDNVNFQLVLPYFNNGGRVDLIESATGSVKLSVDISKYFTPTTDVTPPSVVMLSPPTGCALQDGATFIASVTDDSGVESVTFSIREDDGGTGTPIGFEDLVPDYDSTTGIATLALDTLQLPDGYYLVVVSATDIDGNSDSITVPYSIRNWGVIEQLPATPNSKAGRTMPIKFAIRVVDSVDPAQPFVYNDDLKIKIFATSDPSNILQTSQFGSNARDYRIENEGQYITNFENDEHYITNFKTSKVPMQYTVEIWRTDNNFLVGNFTFETVK